MKTKKGFMDVYKRYDTSTGFGNPGQWKDAFETRMNLRKNSEEETAAVKEAYSLYSCQTFEALRSEYRRLMKLYHPDHRAESEQHKIIAQAINDVYWNLKTKKFNQIK